MKNGDIESVMAELGFSRYEARAYAALAEGRPLTGYELSKRSGIPGSKVYECLERLNRKNLIVSVGDHPPRYVAVPPEELVRRLTRDFEHSVKTLKNLLAGRSRAEAVDYIFNINGYDEIMDKAEEMVRQAGRTLDMSVWSREMGRLAGPIREAVERGVDVRILSFNGGEAGLPVRVYHHKPLSGSDSAARWITVVRDGNEVLTGQCSGGGTPVAAWTRNRCLVFISLKYIEHEIIKITNNVT